MPLRYLKKIGDALLGRPAAAKQDAHRTAAPPASRRHHPETSPLPAATPAPRRPERPRRPAPPAAARERAARAVEQPRDRIRELRPRPEHRPAATGAAPHPAPAPAATTPWTLAQFDVPPAAGRKRFHDFDLPVEIMHAIADLGFQYCTPIQAASLEQALAGANVAGRAQTGTGKTAAFLVAILTRYLRSPGGRADKPATPRALVIAPTRELCVQICRDAQALGKYCGLRTLAVFGGMDYVRQQRQLAEGPVDLLIATPGRLLDFQRQRVVDLSRVDTLVIDEADRMLDMGFIPDVRRIVHCLPDRDHRKTMLYSATLDGEVMRLAAQWMPNPVLVEIEPEHVAGSDIEQIVYIVTAAEKPAVLCNLLKRHAGERVLIFGNRRMSTDRLAMRLRRQGFACELLSGDVQQTRRMRVLEDFRSGAVKIVVATDVAGRGLHIADIGLVVNFELPYEAEDYVHRIGRTGRAGKVGKAVSFACEDESFAIPEIEKFLGETLKCRQPEEELLQPLPPPAQRDAGFGAGDAATHGRQRDGRAGGRGGRGDGRGTGDRNRPFRHGDDRRPHGGQRRPEPARAPRTPRPADTPAASAPPAAAPVASIPPAAPVKPPAAPRTPSEVWVPGNKPRA